MNNKAASCLLGVLLGWQTWALAQERPAPGYTVEVDVTVSAEGAVEEVFDRIGMLRGVFGYNLDHGGRV